jgi:hypothetical protein
LEWVEGGATLETALQAAEVLDSWPLQYEVDSDQFVFLREVLDELKRVESGLEIPQFRILHLRVLGGAAVRALGLLHQAFPGFLDEADIPVYHRGTAMSASVPFVPVTEHVRTAYEFKRKSAPSYAERVAGYQEALTYDIANAPRDAIRNDSIRVGWLKRFLRIDRIIGAMRTEREVDELLRRVDFDRCPSLRLWWAAREQRIRQGNAPKDNDVDDWAFLQVIPYADLVLTERSLTSAVLRGDPSLSSRIVSDPREAARIMHAWGD